MTQYAGIMHIRSSASAKVLCGNRRAVLATSLETLTLGHSERVCEKCERRVSPAGKARIAAVEAARKMLREAV